MAEPMVNPQRTGLALRDPIAWHDFLQVARAAEETSYEAVFVPEIAGREAFATLAALAVVGPPWVGLRVGGPQCE